MNEDTKKLSRGEYVDKWSHFHITLMRRRTRIRIEVNVIRLRGIGIRIKVIRGIPIPNTVKRYATLKKENLEAIWSQRKQERERQKNTFLNFLTFCKKA
jgi:hypothetical protein